ncbi:hypothetical protein CRYUN_Cryun12cG0100100 [Craigia yunnanensis]
MTWGKTALALRLLLALFSSKKSSDVNRPLGDEIRAARNASKEVVAQIVLGDRPIEVTSRSSYDYRNEQKWLIVIDYDANRTTKMIPFCFYEGLSFSNPSLLQPLIRERDTWWGDRKGAHEWSYICISMGSTKIPSEAESNDWVEHLFNSLVRDRFIGIVLWALYELIIAGL